MSTENSNRDLTIELVLTIAVPAVTLMFLSSEDRLGPALGLIVALLGPLSHGTYTMVQSRTVSPIAVVALAGVLLTGGVGLLELDPAWIAVKEGLIPTVMGVGLIGSTRTDYHLLAKVLDRILDSEKVHASLDDKDASSHYEASLDQNTVYGGLLFIAAGVASFVLCRYMVVSDAGTEAFNTELGTFTAVSFGVISIPLALGLTLLLSRVLNVLEEHAGVKVDELLRK